MVGIAKGVFVAAAIRTNKTSSNKLAYIIWQNKRPKFFAMLITKNLQKHFHLFFF